MMNVWEKQLRSLFDEDLFRYELRPSMTGPVLFCTTCIHALNDGTTSVLTDLLDEARKHEESVHCGHKSAKGSN